MDVRNYALIEHISIQFGDGFNVLTGETGAGKSLIIDCLGLVVGGRASAESVRTGAESAVVEAVFDLSGMAQMADILSQQGIDPEPDGTLVISREVWPQGRSRCRVNGRTVTLTSLAAIGECLVDIYGQHEYQSLARPSRHLALLDSLAAKSFLWPSRRTKADMPCGGRLAVSYPSLRQAPVSVLGESIF